MEKQNYPHLYNNFPGNYTGLNLFYKGEKIDVGNLKC
jgi:hypothetical protein